MALLSAMSLGCGVITAAAVGVVLAPASAAGFTAPAVVKDVSANGVATGQLFGGRNERMAVNPVNSNIVLAAEEKGGLWRSVDKGAHWVHVDGLPLSFMDDVQFAASDANLVIASGEYASTSTTKTAEIYVSTDGGNGWARAVTTSCGGNARSAHKIAIGAGTPGSLPVYVATDCGLVSSADSGATWTNVNPNGVSDQFWDVKIRGTAPNYIVDTCDAGGSFFRSTNGGAFTETAGALQGGSLPCRIATAPTNAQVVFLAFFSKNPSPVDGLCMGQLLESDNGGGTFTDLTATKDGNCRPANVVTAPAFAGGSATQFELFFATDSNWIHQQCDLSRLPGSTACVPGDGNNGGSFSDYDSSIQAIHNAPDSADLAFGADGCPFLSSGDGGIFATSDGCNVPSPSFVTANVGLHALDSTGHAGSSYTGHTDLYFSTQDNGIWNTGDGGGSWGQRGPDVYGVFADQDGPPSQVIYKECCFISGGVPTSKLKTNNEGMTSEGTLSSPPGNQPAFGNILGAQFGYQSYAQITSDSTPTWRIYVTTNNGGTWTQLGADLPAGSSPQQLLASGPSASPTFYLLNRVGGVGNLTRISGPLNGSATSTAIGAGLANPGLIAVSPTNPLNLYAEDNNGAGALARSTNGGSTFTTDNALTSQVTGGGAFDLPGSVTAIGMDGNSGTVLVGTTQNGIFASTNGGGVWSQLRGSTQVTRPVGFFFDEKTGKAYAASSGRAEWEIDLPHADLSVTKTHTPDPVIAGQQLTWQVTVTNNGPDPAPDVVVTDTLPAQVDYLTSNLTPPAGCTAAGQVLTCSIGDLNVSQSVTFKIVTLVHSDTVSAAGGPTSITNTVSATSPAVIDQVPSNNTYSDTALVNDSADLAITKICKPDTTIYAGTPINCSVFIDNLGPSWARNVVVNDTTLSSGNFAISQVATSPSGGSCAVAGVTGGQNITCNLGNLAPASTTATGRITLTYTLTANDGQNLDNTVKVSADTPDPNLANNATSVNLTVSAVADLGLTKTAPASVTAGQPITWSLSVANSGPSAAVNGVIHDTVPAGVTITSVAMPGGTCTAGVPGDATHPTDCAFPTLASGATSATMTITATVNPQTTGVLHNDARVVSDTFDTNTANNLAHTDTTVNVRSALSVAVAATPNPVTAGTPLSYQITVSNAGPSTATAVSLTDPLPAGVSFVSTGGVGTCGYQTNTTTVTCALPNLDPGQSEVVFIYTTVNASTLPPSVTNAATAAAPSSPNATGSVTTAVQTRADLSITLASDANVYKPSTTIHYQVTVVNYGPSDAQHVVIVDNLPAVKQGKYISNDIGCPPPVGVTLSCKDPSVPALAVIRSGASVTFQVNFYITGNKQTITSTATVSSQTSDLVTPNNTSTRVVTVK